MATFSAELLDEALDAMLANLNGGLARFYTGAAPADPVDPPTGTLLAELTLGSPAFAASAAGEAVINAVTAEDAALATGVAGYCRFTKTDGTTGGIDAVVGGSLRATGSVSVGELLLTTLAAHGYVASDPVRFFVEGAGTLPTGLVEGTTVYVSATGLGATTFKVSLTAGGAPITYTDAGTGNFRVKAAASEIALSSSDGSIALGVEVGLSGFVARISGV